MKLPHLPLPRRFVPSHTPLGLVRLAAWLIVIVWGVWLGWSLFRTVASDLLAPSPIDPSQISAGQEKVNRKLLDTVNRQDAQKKETAVPPELTQDPFGE